MNSRPLTSQIVRGELFFLLFMMFVTRSCAHFHAAYASGVKYIDSPLFAFLFHLSFLREKKKEKEREELWKRLEDLELKRSLQCDGIIPT